MEKARKKVFISYSWVVQDRVKELADELIGDGVKVLVDFYDLKEGQDKYAFMEQSVNDASVDKVLIICDRSYQEKANDRKGGVGEETIIITPEIYAKIEQEKFIPIIFEVDEENKPYVPHYMKSRIYIDLSNDEVYDAGYEKLLRNIYDKPLFKKPALGKKPEWLENETVDLSGIRSCIKQLRGADGNEQKRNYLLRTIADKFCEAAKAYALPENQPIEDSLLKAIDETKSFRDLFMEYCEVLFNKDMPISQTLTSNFEQLFNELNANMQGIKSDRVAYNELYDFIVWELFINTAALLLHFELYKELHDLVTHTYFLETTYWGESVEAFSFTKFRPYFSIIENIKRENCDKPKLRDLAGDILIKREKKPILTGKSISNADIILLQLSNTLKIDGFEHDSWYPWTCSYYGDDVQSIWQKLKSKKHCEKIYPLFGINDLQSLKNMIENSKNIEGHGYGYRVPASILKSIKLEEIGSLN